MLSDEQLSPEQIAAYRRMSPDEKLEIVQQMYWADWKLKAAGVRQQHPEWSEDQITAEVRRIVLQAQIRHAEEERSIFMKLRDNSPGSNTSPT